MRDRSMAFVIRDRKILVEKLFCFNRSFYSITELITLLPTGF